MMPHIFSILIFIAFSCSGGDTTQEKDAKTEKIVIGIDIGKSDGQYLETFTQTKCANDKDGDGYGEGCEKGPDCDDNNPNFNQQCPDCKAKIEMGCPCGFGDPAQIPCYNGPEGTQDVGICKGGVHLCVGGYYTACYGEILPTEEICNHQDDDCDGQTDEETMTPCGPCQPKAECSAAGKGTTQGFYPNPQQNSYSVSLNSEGELILNKKLGAAVSAKSKHFIWIANSQENTVSRLDTESGWEVGRYTICVDPSRTSVDPEGNVWVACRGDGRVAKIAYDEYNCIDKNNNGVIETSKDVDGDHKINPNDPKELLPSGQDECVRFIVQPDAPNAIARAAASDKDGYGWIGLWEPKRVVKLHPDTGSVVQDIKIDVNPYGFAFDQQGNLWVSGRGGGKLVRIFTNKDPLTYESLTPDVPCKELYGIAVDGNGNVWLGNSSCEYVLVYRPQQGDWKVVVVNVGLGYTRGIAASKEGLVFVAHHTFGCVGSSNSVTVIDANKFKVVTSYALGPNKIRGPVGVALDPQGKLWAVNQCTSTATRLDPSNGMILGEYPTGKGPYTYSDMTGYALQNFAITKGYYRHIFKSQLQGQVKWTMIWVDAIMPEKTHIKVRARAADSGGDLKSASFSIYKGPFPPATFPVDVTDLNLVGHYIEIEVSLYSSAAQATPVVSSIKALAVEL